MKVSCLLFLTISFSKINNCDGVIRNSIFQLVLLDNKSNIIKYSNKNSGNYSLLCYKNFLYFSANIEGNGKCSVVYHPSELHKHVIT